MSMRDIQYYEQQNNENLLSANGDKTTIIFVDPEQDCLNTEIQGVIIEKIYSEVTSMSVNEPCFCGSGKKQKKCHPDINPNSVAAQLIKTFYKLNLEISNIDNTACYNGCAECCTNDFEISISEFMMIFRYINLELTKEQIDKIIDTAKNGKIKLNGKCILLDTNNNSCSIYKVRPIVCRKYGYYKGTEYCEKVLSNKSAIDSLLDKSFDTEINVNKFNYRGKVVFPMKRTMLYWFSKCNDGKFTVEKLNKLYYACFNRPINEYIDIMMI